MQHVRNVVSGFKTCVAVASVTYMVAVQGVNADVPVALSQAPEGAQLVAIIPSMSELSGKLAMLNQTLGIDQDEMTDALGAFKAEVGIGDGLDDAGSALFVVQDLATAIQAEEEPDVLMILPVTDYAAFVASFQAEGAAPAGAGVTELVLPDGQAGFAKESGGYAVLGNSEQAVADYTPGGDADAVGSRVGELGQHYLAGCDAAIYIDLEALAPTLITAIDEGITEALASFEQVAEMGMMQESDLETMRAMMTLYATAGKAIVGSSQGFVVALDINEHGIGITDSIQFKADSPVMKYLPGGGSGTASILARLPKGSYIVAGAYDAKSLAFSDLFEAAMAVLPEDNPQADLYRKCMPLVKQVQQYAGVFYTPDPNALMTGTGALNVLQTYKVDDSASFMTQAKDYISDMNGMSIPMAVPGVGADGEEAAMTYTTSYTDNALQLDGVQVDQYSMQVQMPQQMMMQMGPMAGMMQMFTNFNGYATEDDGHYISSTTLDQQLISKGLASGKTGDGMGADDKLAEVREKAIPPGAAAEAYLSFAGIIETVGPMAMMFGMPAIEAPQDLAPVAVGLGIQGNSSAARFYVPNETIKFIIDTVKDVQTQMMPGPGGPAEQEAQPYGEGAPPPPF
jgi:hypothetical protein